MKILTLTAVPAHGMEAHERGGRDGVQLYSFLTSALDTGERRIVVLDSFMSAKEIR